MNATAGEDFRDELPSIAQVERAAADTADPAEARRFLNLAAMMRLAAQLPQEHPRSCRVCGCTDADCSACIERTGDPCFWVEADLCSACAKGRAQ